MPRKSSIGAEENIEEVEESQRGENTTVLEIEGKKTITLDLDQLEGEELLDELQIPKKESSSVRKDATKKRTFEEPLKRATKQIKLSNEDPNSQENQDI